MRRRGGAVLAGVVADAFGILAAIWVVAALTAAWVGVRFAVIPPG